MAREATAQDKVRMTRMLIDHEMLVGRQGVHTWLGFPESLDRAWHPLFQGPGDWFYVAGLVNLTVNLLRICQIPIAMKGRFDSIAEIWKAIERCGKAFPVHQESGETGGIISMSSRPEPCLDIALHPNANAEGL